jgi:hypothetical protein
VAEPTLEQKLAELEAANEKVKTSFAKMGQTAQAGAAAMSASFKKAAAAFAELAPLLAEPELEPESVPEGLEPPAPVAEVAATRPQNGAVGPGAAAAARRPPERENGSQELAEAKWDEHLHPRWPKGTPGGLGGQFMHVGQRFKWKGEWYDVDQVLPGGVYAHVATRGKHGKAAYVWIPSAPKKTAEGTVQEIPEVERPPAEVVVGEKEMGGKYGPPEKLTQTVIDPYVQPDHDPSIPIPPEAPKELTPERWQRFGRADQLRYTDLMKEFGAWKAGAAQSLVNQALANQSQDAVQFVKSSYSSQFGSSSGFTISLISKFKSFLPGGGKAQQEVVEKVFREYEEAKMVQDAAARAIQWDLYNRTKSPDISIFHKSHDAASFWKTSIISGEAPIFSGLSQTQHYRIGGFGHVAVCTPVAIRNVVLATTSADVVGHSFKGEQEIALRDPASLDTRSLVFDDSALGNAGQWLHKVTTKGADGTVLDMLGDYMKTGDIGNLPIPPEPANITTLGAGGVQTWVPPPADAIVGVGKFKYADVDANGAPLPKPAASLELKPGDYIEGMQGTRYIILEDKGDPFGVRYYKVTDGGAEQPDGSFAGHEDFKGEECYTFEGQGAKPFKKLQGHAELPSAAAEAKTGFVAQAWSETAADQGKLTSQLEPGTKFIVGGVPWQVEQQLPGGQVKIENLETGGLAQINGTYKTPWLVLKAGYTEAGVPAFQPSDYFVRPPALLSELGLKEGDIFYAGKEGQIAWRVIGEQGTDGTWQVQGVSAGKEGKANKIGPEQTGRLLEPKPVGWLPPAVGDTLAIDGKKGEVTKLLAGGVVQVNLKPGVVKLKPDDWRLAGLYRPEGHQVGEKLKLRDFGVGEKFHGGSGERVRPYLVLEKDVPRGKGKPKGVRVRNLDTGEEMVMPGTRSYSRLNPKGTSQPEPGAPAHTPVDHSSVFDPNAWKVGESVPTTELSVGDKLKGGSTYYEVSADKGAAWEWKDLLTGEHLAVTKSATEVEKLEPSGVVPVTGFDPDAYNVGAPKKLSELKKGDIFQGTKKGKHYVVKTTGAKSGLSAMDLETGKVSSPWSYDKVAPVLEQKGPAVTHQGLLDGDLVTLDKLHAGDQFLAKGQLLEVVEPTSSESDNVLAAPVIEGNLGFPSKVGHYPGLLVTFHEKEPPPPPEAPPPPAFDPATAPTFDVNAFSPKSKTGGGYVFSKAKNAAPGTILKDKDGKLFKVVTTGADPVVSNGDAQGWIPGESNLKVVEEPFVDHAGAAPEPPVLQTFVGGGPKAAVPALQQVAAAKEGDWADNTVVKLSLHDLKPGDVWKSTADSPAAFASLGPVPGSDELVYAQNLQNGDVMTHAGTGVPDLVSPAAGLFFETNFGGWQPAGEKSGDQLEPGDYYRPELAGVVGEPAAQVIENKGGGALVVRAVAAGTGMGLGEPVEVQVSGKVAVYEPIPAGAAPGPGVAVPAGSLSVGAHFTTGGAQGVPGGTYEVISWADVPGSAAAMKAEYGVPAEMDVKADAIWVQNVASGQIAWVGDALAVQPTDVAAPSADPADYDETGAFVTLGDLEPGDFFKSAQGAVWQVGQEQQGQVKVTKVEDGKEAWGSTSMPTTKIVPKAAPPAGSFAELEATGLAVGDTVTWLTPDVGGGKWGKVIGFESGTPTNVKVQVEGEPNFYVVGASKLAKAAYGGRPHDPDEWEFDADVPAHTLEPGDKFSFQGDHYVVEEGPPPAALGEKLAGDPEWGWVTNLATGKSVAFKNTPGETGDKLLSKLKPKAEFKGGGGLVPNDDGVTVGDLSIGDRFYDGAKVWEIESIDHPANAVTAFNVAAPDEKANWLGSTVPIEVPAHTVDDQFGPPPPQEDLIVNDAGIQLGQLAVGDHFGFDDARWEVVEILDSAVVGRNLETNEMLEWLPDDVPEEIPAYQHPPPGPVAADLAVLSSDFFSKGPLPKNAAQVQLSELPVGSLVQMEPEEIASGTSEQAVWRLVDPAAGEVEIVVPAPGGYQPGHKHTFGPDQVFDRAITPAAMGSAKALGVPWTDPSDYGHAVPPEPAPPSTTGLIGVPPNVTNLAVGDMPVGALVQEEPTAFTEKPAVWRVTGHEGGLVQMEIVEPSSSAEAMPVGHKLDFDPDKVFPRVLVQPVPGPAGEPGTIGALEPGDHFLKGGVVYQVEGPAPGLEGSHIRALSVTPVGATPGATDTVDYPVGTQVVKVPPPAGAALGPELAAPTPGEFGPFPALADDELAAKVPLTDVPVGQRFKMVKGPAGDTYRVAGVDDDGAVLVATASNPGHVFPFSKPDTSVWVGDAPTSDDLPPTKDWAEFQLGDEAWTLGGKHGHFESPESGPAQYEKAFLIDGDPTPHQFTGQLYTADPFGGPPAAGPELAGATPLTVADLWDKVGTTFTLPETGHGKTFTVTAPGWAESTDGEMTLALDPGSTVPAVKVRPPGGESPLGGGKPGDRIELSGITYTIVADTGDSYSVETEAGDPAGSISKWNEQAKLIQAKEEADVKAGKGKLSTAKVLKPYSAKSKSGGGYFFADLGNMAEGDEFTDKTGTVYVVRGKTADGYNVRFHKKGEPGTYWMAPAGSRVKLPK